MKFFVEKKTEINSKLDLELCLRIIAFQVERLFLLLKSMPIANSSAYVYLNLFPIFTLFKCLPHNSIYLFIFGIFIISFIYDEEGGPK